MNRKRMNLVSAALLSVMVLPAIAQSPQHLRRTFEEAERRMVRLSPTAFRGLPGKAVRELQRRGCTIPQTPYTQEPHNVIKGEFVKPGETDWAVLCSVNGVSTVLVFWNGSDANPAALAPMEDRIFLQTMNATEVGFSRQINPVGRDFIMRHYKAYGGPEPPAIDHKGIDDAFIEKGSSVWYFHLGKWLKLSGSD